MFGPLASSGYIETMENVLCAFETNVCFAMVGWVESSVRVCEI